MSVAETTKPSTDLTVVSTINAAVVFAPGGAEAILEKIRTEVRSVKTDISTPTGRAAIASLAYKVARSKTALDEMGKDLAAEWKAKAGAVDAERRVIRDELDALKDEVRKPLTDWENLEKARVAAHEAALVEIANVVEFLEVEPSLAEIEAALIGLSELPKRDWQEFSQRAGEALASALAQLTALRDRTLKREAERAELDRLRREQVERERREREERVAAEAAERARHEAEAEAAFAAEAAASAAEAERRRIEHEKADAIARAEQAERDRVNAEERARVALEKAETDKKAALDRAEREKADALRQAEADRIAAAQAAERERDAAIEAERRRVADAKAAEEAETARREANKRHRTKINNEALAALIAAGIDEAVARVAIVAIAKGDVPHIKISY